MKTLNNKKLYQIGEIAKMAGTSVRTVRYYLEEGFIEAADRSDGGFYLFSADAADTVFFVRKLKDAGLALKDIKAIYRARRGGVTGNEVYAQVAALLREQKALVEKKIADYRQLKTELEQAIDLVGQCKGCRLEPTRQNCETCSVVTAKEKLPVPVQAIL